MSHSLDHFLQRCDFPAEQDSLICAVSGGADSMALLVLAAATGAKVEAIHVDHGIRPGSDADAGVVRAASEHLGASFTSKTAHVEPGPNLEARAREARYGLLPSTALTGHTADDQAETVLLQLLRGAGPNGGSGIGSRLDRPLIGLRRAETEQVCRLAGIEPLHDPSNDDPLHRRNRIRHEVLPLLNDVADRDVVPLLVRHAELSAEAAEVVEGLIGDIDLADTRQLAALPLGLQRVAVRAWLRAQQPDRYPTDRAATDRILRVVSHEIRATEIAGGLRVARTDGRLRLESADVPPT